MRASRVRDRCSRGRCVRVWSRGGASVRVHAAPGPSRVPVKGTKEIKPEIAAKHQRSAETLRSQLKAIFVKTATHTQSEVVALAHFASLLPAA